MIAFGWIYTDQHGAPEGKIKAIINYVKDTEHPGYKRLKKKVSFTSKDAGKVVDWAEAKLGGRVTLTQTPLGLRITEVK